MNDTVHCTSLAIFDLRKLNKAIERLESICFAPGEQIIEHLMDYEDLPFIDLLIKTGMDQDDLQDQLDLMVASGVLKKEMVYYQPTYRLNERKLNKIIRIASVVAK